MAVFRKVVAALIVPVTGLLSGCFMSDKSLVSDADAVYPLPDNSQLIQYEAKPADQCTKLDLFGLSEPREMRGGNVLCPIQVLNVRRLASGYEFPPLIPDGKPPMRAKFVEGRAGMHYVELALTTDSGPAYLYALGDINAENGTTYTVSMWVPFCSENPSAYDYAGPSKPQDVSSCYIPSASAFASVMPILLRDTSLNTADMAYVFGVRQTENRIKRFSHGDDEFFFDELVAADRDTDEPDFIMDDMCDILTAEDEKDPSKLNCWSMVESLYGSLSKVYEELDEAGQAKMLQCLKGRPLDLNFGDLAVIDCLKA